MQASSPLLHIPSTPLSSHTKYPALGRGFQPLNSSPLASPSPKSSPVAAAQARRRLQFKARTPSTPVASSSRSFQSARSITCSEGSIFRGGIAPASAADPQKTFLREKFKARCFERAARAREKAVRGKRYASEASSDGFDDAMDDDEEEDDDDIMQDELFRRIMANTSSKQRHSYRVSYAHDVGSSFDPDLDDINEWERELNDTFNSPNSPSKSAIPFTLQCPTPVDLDDAELEAYAEECATRAALADFEDIPPEDLFSWSDSEELNGADNHDEDVEMMH